MGVRIWNLEGGAAVRKELKRLEFRTLSYEAPAVKQAAPETSRQTAAGEEKRSEAMAFLKTQKSIGLAAGGAETHEGQCFLYPRKEEDFSSVLKSEGWSPGITGGARLPCYMKSSWLDPQPNNFPEST